MNVYDIAAALFVAAVLIFAVVLMVRKKKRGSSCSCGCASCTMPCNKKNGEDV